jgi:hypothetical protein
VRTLLGLEGDLLDAVVLGPRLAAGNGILITASSGRFDQAL